MDELMEINFGDEMAILATQSLLYEAVTWPKPGLVTPVSSGKHSDMNIYHFMNSSVSLYPYFKRLTLLAQEPYSLKEIFESSRELGKNAEERMYLETEGVNTHKGAIFILGILVMAFSYTRSRGLDFSTLSESVKEMTKGIVKGDFLGIKQATTHGERLFIEEKIEGIRGEAEKGFPIIFQLGLPYFESLEGNLEKKILQTLIFVIQYLEDTTILHKEPIKILIELQTLAKECIEMGGIFTEEGIYKYQKLEEFCLKRRVSPGGAADCIAGILFLSRARERFFR